MMEVVAAGGGDGGGGGGGSGQVGGGGDGQTESMETAVQHLIHQPLQCRSCPAK